MNGIVSDKFGYRYTVIACLLCITGFTTIFFNAQNVQTLLISEILCGIGSSRTSPFPPSTKH
jgi:MFS transporter, SP family, general alpha glucoside:H+ symporter